MLIRAEHARDWTTIAAVTAEAFAGAEHSDGTEAGIVSRLRATAALAISLVAVDRDRLVGHVAFSPVTIDGTASGWFGLGPLSVVPDRQREGIGTVLVEEGLRRLRLRGAGGCVVLGEAAFYGRFGFERDDRLTYAGAPPEYFMRIALAPAAPGGRVAYAPAFSG